MLLNKLKINKQSDADPNRVGLYARVSQDTLKAKLVRGAIYIVADSL